MAKTKTATTTERSDNRYVRAFRVLATNNKLPIDELAKQADIPERTARSCVDIWNSVTLPPECPHS